MLKKLLLVALTSITYASALTIESSDNVNSIYSQNEIIANANSSYNQNYFIDLGSPNFRLGDYEVTRLMYYSVTNRSSIEVIIPYTVFDELSAFETVFISIPGYSSNSTAILSMRIDLYDSQGYFDCAIAGYPNIPLNEFMLAKTGFTVTDNPPYYYNLFDPNVWDYPSHMYEIRLVFYVPTDFIDGSPDFLKDITLFTKLGSYSDGYSDGYIDGIQEGISTAEGTWLGNLIFGTVGSVVGFIFAISDFEVLGVSIMSIITLFVAVGIIMLFIKLIKGTS